MNLHCGQFILDLAIPRVMGILNVTPDSFSDGGQYSQTDLAVTHALKLVAEGVDVIDIGGESTRPNAIAVSLQEELDRVIPVIEAVVGKVNVPISIDTYKPAVMRAAIAAGASMVNDVKALQEDGAVAAVSETDVGICLMHMQGTPQTMQAAPRYSNVTEEVSSFLMQRVDACQQAGITKNRIMVDPGFGFGKTRVHNMTLAKELASISALGMPMLVGLSRKSVLGQVTGQDVSARLHASVAAAVIATMKGANIVRVHDVKATVDALKVVSAIQ